MDPVLRRARASELVPFVGAGVPRSIRNVKTGKPLTPTWTEFLLAAANEIPNDAAETVRQSILASDLTSAASTIRESMRAPTWNALLREQFEPRFDDVRLTDLQIQRAIWSASHGLIITTNYDESLLWGIPPGSPVPTVHGLDSAIDLSGLLGATVRTPVLWHLHGRIAYPSSLVLSQEGYAGLYTPNETTERRLKAALVSLSTIAATRSLLFVGFSFADTAVMGVLRDVAELFPDARHGHFAICPAPEEEQIRERLEKNGLGDIETISAPGYGQPIISLIDQLSEAPRKRSLSGGGGQSWIRRRCRTIVGARAQFRRKIVPLLAEHRPSSAQQLLAELAIEYTGGYEAAVSRAMMYEFQGKIDRMLSATQDGIDSSTSAQERLDLLLFRGIAFDKLNRIPAAKDTYAEILSHPDLDSEMELCARFNLDVCREKADEDVSFSAYMSDRKHRFSSGELLWPKAFNMELVRCGRRGLPFEYAGLLQPALLEEMAEASTGFGKTIVNWAHFSGETMDPFVIQRVEEVAKTASPSVRLPLLTYLSSIMDDPRLKAAINETLELSGHSSVIQRLVPARRICGRYTLYGEFLMHETTWGYVAPVPMYLEARSGEGAWVPPNDHVRSTIASMGLEVLESVSGNLPFGEGFASSTVLALLHLRDQLDSATTERLVTHLDWQTHGFRPSGVDVAAIEAGEPGLFLAGTWRSTSAANLEIAFVSTPKGLDTPLNKVRRRVQAISPILAPLADAMSDALDRHDPLPLDVLTEYCKVLLNAGVYSPSQESFVAQSLALGMPAKAIGGLYNKAILVVGPSTSVAALVERFSGAKLVGSIAVETAD